MTLTDKWRDGVRTLHGLAVNGFPNCFILSIAQSGFTVNFPYLLDVQARHTAEVIAWALSHDATEVEASVDAETAWVDSVPRARHTGRIRDPHRYSSMTMRGRYLAGRLRAMTRRGRSPRVVIIDAGFGGLGAHSELDYARATWRIRSRDWLHRT